MDDKLKLKSYHEEKLIEGRSKFSEYLNSNRIKEWVNEYLPFMDENSKDSIVKCYNQLYKDTKCENNNA
jgi:hypothetical protein